MRTLEISFIIVFVSLSFQYCSTVKKQAVSCPEFSVRKFNSSKNKIKWNISDINKVNLKNRNSRRKSFSAAKHSNNKIVYDIPVGNKPLLDDKIEFIGLPVKTKYLKKLEVSAANEIYSQNEAGDIPITTIKGSKDSSFRLYNKDQKDFFPQNKAKRKLDPVGVAGFALSIAGLPFLGSLSFALISLLLAGCLLGWISSNRIKKHPEKLKGRGLAQISIVLGYALLIFLVLFVLIVLISKIV